MPRGANRTIEKTGNNAYFNDRIKKKLKTKHCIYFLKENLAFNKPTWQTMEKTSSQYAVDGRREDDSANGDLCAESYGSKENTWLVDLEAIQSISRIVIYHKTGGGSFGKSITIILVKSIGILKKGTF